MNKLTFNLILILVILSFNLSGQDKPIPPNFKMEEVLTATEKNKNFIYRTKSNELYGFNKSDKVYIPLIYQELPESISNFMIAKKDNKYGVIDSLNMTIIPFEYDDLNLITTTMDLEKVVYLKASKGSLKGILSLTNKIIIPLQYKEIETFKLMYKVMTEDGKFGLFDLNGKVILSSEYENSFEERKKGWFKTRKQNKYGVVSIKDKVIVPFEYEYHNIKVTSKGYLILKKKQRSWVLNPEGEEIIPPIYKSISIKSNDYFEVETDDFKKGIIDSFGNLIVPAKYNSLHVYTLRKTPEKILFIVRLKDEKRLDSGVINSDGEFILPLGEYNSIKFDYSSIPSFFYTKKNGDALFAIFDIEKEIHITEASYKGVKFDNKRLGYSKVSKSTNEKLALISPQGIELTDFIYDSLQFLNSNGVIKVKYSTNDKKEKGYLDSNGKVIQIYKN